jgi:hypothetical protein
MAWPLVNLLYLTTFPIPYRRIFYVTLKSNWAC